MLPQKYHALAFLSILVMLLLLGLHLLGFGLLGSGSLSSSGSAPQRAALARANSSGLAGSSSLLSPTGASSTLNPNAVYRHPILYDKLTGATNNEITEVLGGSPANSASSGGNPLDHYQQQSQQQVRSQNPFDQFPGQGDPSAGPFGNLGLSRQFGPPPPLGHHHGMGRAPPGMVGMPAHHQHLPPHLQPLPPPPPPPPTPSHMSMTTQPPQQQPQHLLQPTAAVAEPRHSQQQQQQQQDSIPSASSVNNNGAARPLNTSQPYYNQQQQQQQPVYYTPPIFTYNNNNFDPPPSQQQVGGPYGGPPQVPPLGVPEVPLSVDEYNARQNRLRQLSPHQLQHNPPGDENNSKQVVNLLADPQAQQRHKQQMLDRQLLFGNQQLGFMQPPPPLDNYTTSAAYYPDPALYARLQHQQQQPHSQQAASIRPPYAHQMPTQASYQAPAQTQLEAPTQLAPTQPHHSQQQLKQPPPPPQNRIQRPPERLVPSPPPPPPQQRQQPLVASSVVRSGQQAPSTATSTAAASTRLPLHEAPAPACARQQQAQSFTSSSLELANSTSQLPVLFCNEDPDYPTTEIMRALEQYAADRSIELILPQQLVHMLTSANGRTGGADNNPKLADLQRQLSLDSLQANINAQQVSNSHSHSSGDETASTNQQQAPAGVFPTSNYDSLCRSATWMAQPRRAKNLSGQWKVVVNLPGHKFRGIAISQMVRVDECTRPNGECSAAALPGQLVVASAKQTPMPARSRCLQQYDNQRLLAWSNQQGLHFDIFRVPIACSCHIRRF